MASVLCMKLVQFQAIKRYFMFNALLLGADQKNTVGGTSNEQKLNLYNYQNAPLLFAREARKRYILLCVALSSHTWLGHGVREKDTSTLPPLDTLTQSWPISLRRTNELITVDPREALLVEFQGKGQSYRAPKSSATITKSFASKILETNKSSTASCHYI